MSGVWHSDELYVVLSLRCRFQFVANLCACLFHSIFMLFILYQQDGWTILFSSEHGMKWKMKLGGRALAVEVDLEQIPILIEPSLQAEGKCFHSSNKSKYLAILTRAEK